MPLDFIALCNRDLVVLNVFGLISTMYMDYHNAVGLRALQHCVIEIW